MWETLAFWIVTARDLPRRVYAAPQEGMKNYSGRRFIFGGPSVNPRINAWYDEADS